MVEAMLFVRVEVGHHSLGPQLELLPTSVSVSERE